MLVRKHDAYRQLVRQRVVESLDFSREITDEEMYELIDRQISSCLRNTVLSLEDKKKLRKEVFHSIRKLDVLQGLLDDPSITEIMVNGTENIFIEKNGVIQGSGISFDSRQKLENVAQQIVASCNRVVNEELSFKKLNWNSYQT